MSIEAVRKAVGDRITNNRREEGRHKCRKKELCLAAKKAKKAGVAAALLKVTNTVAVCSLKDPRNPEKWSSTIR